MFLITTSDKRFWKYDQRIIFLGEWCKTLEDVKNLKNINHTTLNYHWNDRKKFSVDYNYIQNVFEKYLSKLAEEMNLIHKTNFSKRYWRIILGIWLRSFIDATFDRYASLKDATSRHKIKDTLLCSTEKWTPEEPISFGHDDYNLYIISLIIKKLNYFPYTETNLKHIDFDTQNNLKNNNYLSWKISFFIKQFKKFLIIPKLFLKQILASIYIYVWPRIALKFNNKVIFVGEIYLSFFEFLKLCIKLKTLPFIFNSREIFLKKKEANYQIRDKIKLSNPKTEFEEILNFLIPTQIPKIFLENYKQAHKQCISMVKYQPKAILTAFTVNYRVNYEFWAAYSMEKYNTKILVNQHGGFYGTAKHVPLENHIFNSFDKYYTWGNEKGSKIVKKMPSFRLYTTKKKLNSNNPNGRILWVATTQARYKMNAESAPAGPMMINYFESQKFFYTKLSDNVKRLITWRYFANPWQDETRIKQFSSGLKIQLGKKAQFWEKSDFLNALQESKLAVHTANETTYLEALSSNFPSIIFWDPKLYEIRPNVKLPFQKLIDAEILFLDPISAARKVNEIHNNINNWWNTKKVQNAVKYFCRSLAYTEEEIVEIWFKELNDVIT